MAAGPPERPTSEEGCQRGDRSACSPVKLQTSTWRPSRSACDLPKIAPAPAIPCHTAVTTPIQTAVVWQWHLAPDTGIWSSFASVGLGDCELWRCALLDRLRPMWLGA